MKIQYALALALLLAGSPATAVSGQPVPFAARLVTAHNLERRAVGAAPMTWDTHLAAAADAYAIELARTERWGHSPAQQRVGQGENLWMGTRNAFTLEAMMRDWAGEKRLFRGGVFPNVSKSASWQDVGHYTQIVWPATTRVGCSLRSSPRWDYLVCRYSVPGNVMGQRVGPESVAAR